MTISILLKNYLNHPPKLQPSHLSHHRNPCPRRHLHLHFPPINSQNFPSPFPFYLSGCVFYFDKSECSRGKVPLSWRFISCLIYYIYSPASLFTSMAPYPPAPLHFPDTTSFPAPVPVNPPTPVTADDDTFYDGVATRLSEK